MALRSRSRAGAMNGVWKAPLTASGIDLLGAELAGDRCRVVDRSGLPAITTWPGAL